uniref:DNA helicase n=1 Tax=Lotharella vacuolata TaxID=74820 RepID=A0A0H5BHJ8_9EUKA|nr:chromosome maintenance protein [Lotharella vacuolata]
MILSNLQWNNMNLKLKFLHTLIKNFQNFILKFTSKKNYFPYLKQIKIIIIGIKNTFILSFMHLAFSNPYLALWLSEDPTKILYLFNFSIRHIITKIEKNISVTNFPFEILLIEFPLLEKIHFFKIYHINLLIKTCGTVDKIKHLKFFNNSILYNKKSHFLKHNLLSFLVTNIKNNIQILNITQLIYLSDNKRLSDNTFLNSNIKVLIESCFQDIFKTGDKIIITGIYKINLNLFNNKKDFKLPFVIHSNSIANLLSKKYNLFNLLTIFQKFKFTILIKKFCKILIISTIPGLFFMKYVKKILLCFLFTPISKYTQKNSKIFKSLKFLIIGNKNSGKTQILYYINAVTDSSIYINSIIFNKPVKKILTEIYVIKNKIELILEISHLFLKNTLLIDNLNELNTNLILSENSYHLHLNLLYYKINELLLNSKKLIISISFFKKKKSISQLALNKIDFYLPIEQLSLYPNLYNVKTNYCLYFETNKYVCKNKNYISPTFMAQVINFMKYKSMPFLSQTSFSLIIKFYKILRSLLLKVTYKHLSYKMLETMILFSTSISLIRFRNFVDIHSIFFSLKLILQLILIENTTIKKIDLINKVSVLFSSFQKKKKIFKLLVEELVLQFTKLFNYNSLLGKSIIKLNKKIILNNIKVI